MSYKNLYLHNVSELVAIEGVPGLRMQKVPEEVRGALSEWGRTTLQFASNMEIRFVPLADKASFTLAAHGGKVKVEVWFGEFPSAHQFDLDETPLRINLDLDGAHYLSPHVCRLRFWGEGCVLLLETPPDGDVRPPSREEIPQTTLLTYGTSITYGCRASAAHFSYAAVCASRLGADLLNLGMPGAAFCEKEMADYIAGRKDWDMAVLELSVNMVATFNVKDFNERVSYMVSTISGSDLKRPVFCITLLPYHDDYLEDLARKLSFGQPGEYRDALRRVVTDCPHANVSLLEGGDLLTDVRGLCSDLIHPGDLGMMEIGNKLADRICQIPCLKSK